MNNHNNIIYQALIKNNSYKQLNSNPIIDDSKFTQKQYEYILLNMYRNYISAYLPNDSIQIRLLKCNSINGLAFKEKNTYYSLIHWGTIYNLYKYALILTETPTFFPNIISLDNGFVVVSRDTLSKKDLSKETFYTRIYPFGTNDPYRRDLAFLIAFFAWCSTVFHESGHILNGHLDYFKNTFHESGMPIMFDNFDSRKSLTIKTLEKDADEFASNRLADYAFLSNRKIFFENFSHIIKDDNTLIEIMFTGITLKFLLYGIDSTTPNPKYLPNAYRIVSIANSAFHHITISGYSQIPAEIFYSIIQTSIKNTLSAYNSSFSQTIAVHNFVNQINYGANEDILLKKEWNRIYPTLNLYKNPNFTLAPPFVDT